MVASTFPRFAADAEPAFILDLAREVSSFSPVKVFVPNHPSSDDRSDWAGVPVERFRYFPLARHETLCADGGIPAKIGTWKGKILLAFLLAAEVALFLRLFRDARLQVIHVHWVLPQGLAFAVARALFLRKPAALTILSFHSGRDARSSVLYGWLERWIVRRFDRITVNNEKTRGLLESLYARPVLRLSMGLPKDVEAQALPGVKDYRCVVSIGRLVPVKGYLELLRQWSKRKTALKDYSLTLLGKGPLAAAIQDYIRTAGLDDHVSLDPNPSRARIFAALARAGYYLQPSVVLPSGQTEGFGLAVVEALHLGCTPLVSGAGGLPEVVGDAGHVCADAGDMLDALLGGRVRPADPRQCRERASAFAWSRKDLRGLYS
jgi:glycosyltransferase involved in cell wall biosynthesis